MRCGSPLRGSPRARARSVAALVCIALMLVAANIIAARYLPARLDLTAEQLYTLSRGTRQTLGQDRRADHVALLLFDPARRRGAGLRRLRASGCASCSTSTSPPRTARSGSKSTTRSRFPMPRTARSRSGCKGVPLNAAGRAGLFRPRRHQLDRRPAGHRVLRARARALSRIRSDPAGAHAGLSEADRRRADERACRSTAT